jgi:hypothetical protein
MTRIALISEIHANADARAVCVSGERQLDCTRPLMKTGARAFRFAKVSSASSLGHLWAPETGLGRCALSSSRAAG